MSDELLGRMRGGDADALDHALRLYWPSLVSYLERWTGSPDFAEDVAQQAFLRLWDRRAEWRLAGSVRALIFRIARNLAISEYRRLDARTRAEASYATDRPDRIDPSPLDVLESRRLEAALEREIGALPERRREAFILRHIHGLSYREIAEIMGISEQTVANQLSRAVVALRRALAPLLDDEAQDDGE